MPEIETSINQKRHVLLFCLGFVSKENEPHLQIIRAVRFKTTRFYFSVFLILFYTRKYAFDGFVKFYIIDYNIKIQFCKLSY